MLEPGELGDKFRRLTRRAIGEPAAVALFERLQRLEDEKDLSWLGTRPKRALGTPEREVQGPGSAKVTLDSAGIVIAWATPRSICLAGHSGGRDGKIVLLTKELDELLDIDIRQIDGQHLAVRASDPNDTI